MTTLTCTVSGSAIAGANNSRALTISDADLQRVFNWLGSAQLQVIANQFNSGITAGFTPTNAQLEWGWMQVTVVNGTKAAVQQFETTVSQPAQPIIT